jgi:hypothetical protein
MEHPFDYRRATERGCHVIVAGRAPHVLLHWPRPYPNPTQRHKRNLRSALCQYAAWFSATLPRRTRRGFVAHSCLRARRSRVLLGQLSDQRRRRRRGPGGAAPASRSMPCATRRAERTGSVPLGTRPTHTSGGRLFVLVCELRRLVQAVAASRRLCLASQQCSMLWERTQNHQVSARQSPCLQAGACATLTVLDQARTHTSWSIAERVSYPTVKLAE